MPSSARWRRIRELFDAACERDPGTRDAFLRDACAGDEALFAEVRGLLDGDAYAHSLLGGAVRDAASTLDAGLVAGRTIGPWRIARALGRGGMGSVYLAERADGQYQQRAALKLIRRGMDSEQILGRFRRERQILARLQHPNIARLLDGGLTDDGHPYFAMEYVDGEPIDRYGDRWRLTVDQRLTLFLAACEAVRYAHASLVVHRDLKPDNILVTEQGEVRLLDFGIAKLLADDEDLLTLTQTGLRVMTPAYASPEQVRGEPVGTATDVYSLGMILYELLAGVRPYDVDSRNLSDLERIVCRDDPERPSTRLGRTSGVAPEPGEAIAHARGTEVRRLRRRLAGDLDVICLKALRKEPERRYGSVEALAEDVRRHLDGLPVLARPDTLGYRLRKLVRRHRTGVATAAAIVLAVASLTAFYLVRLADERDRARQEAAKATEIAAFLQGLFEISDPSQSRGDTVTARALLEAGAARIADELGGQPEVRTAMMRVIGEVYSSMGLHEEARPLVLGALDRNRALYDEDDAELATSLASAAALLQNTGDAVGAESLLREALTIRERIGGRTAPGSSGVLYRLGYLVEGAGRSDEAETLYREALSGYRQAYAPDHPQIAAVLVRLGGVLRRTGRIDAAEPVLREAVAALRARHGDVHPRVASAVRNLAALLRDKGAYDEADTLYREAVAIRRQLYGADHQDVATTIHSYALLLQRKGDRDRALAAFTEAVQMLERIHPDGHPNLGVGYYDLGLELRERGRYDEAATRFRQAMQMDDHFLPAGHPNLGLSRLGLASVHMAQERYDRAEPVLREAVVQLRAARPGGAGNLGEALSDLGATLAGQTRYAEAEPLLLEAHDMLLAADGPDADLAARTRGRLLTLYEAWGRPTDADRYR